MDHRSSAHCRSARMCMQYHANPVHGSICNSIKIQPRINIRHRWLCTGRSQLVSARKAKIITKPAYFTETRQHAYAGHYLLGDFRSPSRNPLHSSEKRFLKLTPKMAKWKVRCICKPYHRRVSTKVALSISFECVSCHDSAQCCCTDLDACTFPQLPPLPFRL